MQIAPLEVAKYFGHENMIPETEGITPLFFINGTVQIAVILISAERISFCTD